MGHEYDHFGPIAERLEGAIQLGMIRSVATSMTKIENGEQNTSVVKKGVTDLIAAGALLRLDYVTISDPNTFEEMSEILDANRPDL